MSQADEQKKIQDILSQYPTKRAATLPLLYMAQEKFGYISMEGAQWVASFVDISVTEVLETASFYSLFHKKPVGKNKIRVCGTVSCALLGARAVGEKVCQTTGIKNSGESSQDGKFHFEYVECLGYCDQAPAMQVNKKTYKKISPEKIEKVLKEY